MKVYDKASWHIDSGESASDVVVRFQKIFEFLNEKKMLTADGIETLEYAMDSSVSLSSTMVTEAGNDFLVKYYDEILSPSASIIQNRLHEAYKKFEEDE